MTPPDRRPPNILLFVADDLGWGDLGCYGATRIPTPHLDRLAARGVRFTDCHASSAVCTPSRYSLITGRYPWRSPLRAEVLGGVDPSIIRPGLPTIASTLQAQGYQTGAFGKWHLGLGWLHQDGSRRSAFDNPYFTPDMQADGRDIDYTASFDDGPLTHGFDRFFGIAGSLDMPPYCFLDQDHTVGIPDRDKQPLVSSQRPGPQVADWHDDRVDVAFTQAATQWVGECLRDGDPFFGYVASAAPHRPCVPPEFVRGRSDAGPRGDSVCLVDWMVGRLLEVLNAHDALADTVIVFTSDNGAPTRFPEDGDVVNHRPNGPWRGQKADAWEAGHRVPLIIAGPGIRAGAREATTVSLLDVFPTLAAIVPGQSADATGTDGTTIAGLLRDPPTPDEPGITDRVLGQQAFDGTLALRHRDRKVIYGTGSGGFSEPVGEPCAPDSPHGQFYDLADDPGETTNLWAGTRDEAARLHAEFCRSVGFPHQSAAPTASAEKRQP